MSGHSLQAVIGDTFSKPRVYTCESGEVYIARDVVRSYMGETEYFPEHAVVVGGVFCWEPHPEGGQMRPLIESRAREPEAASPTKSADS